MTSMSKKPGKRKPRSKSEARRLDAQRRSDGWNSVLTGLGTSRDKRTSGTFDSDLLSVEEARDLWRGDDIAARAIETVPGEMFREGYCVKVQVEDDGDAEAARELAEAIEARLQELDADARFIEALEFERAYGGGVVMPVMNDGSKDLSKPLAEENVMEVKRLVSFEARELLAEKWYTDPTDPKYGTPETYRLVPISAHVAPRGGNVVIHETRLIIFPGIRVSRAQVSMLPGWGDGALTRMFDVLRDFNVSWGSAGHLLADFAQAVYKIQGLFQAVAADESDVILRRMEVMDASRSMIRGILLDAGGDGAPAEDFERKTTPLTGLPELLDRMCNRLAAACDMPVTLLMGQAPAGLNATGAADIRFFYDRVARLQKTKLQPALERLVRLVMLDRGGPAKGVEPDKWTVEFKPLWQPSEKEQVDARKVQADIDAIYIDRGLPAEDVFRSRFGGDGYSFDTKVDFDAMDDILAAQAQVPAPGTAPPGAQEPPPDAPAQEPPPADEPAPDEAPVDDTQES